MPLDLSKVFEEQEKENAPLVEVQTLERLKIYEVGYDCIMHLTEGPHPERTLRKGTFFNIQGIYDTHYHLMTSTGIHFSVLPTQKIPVLKSN